MKSTISYPQRWSTAQKLAFRFFGIYFMLYIFPFPLGYVPYLSKLGEWWADIWHWIVPKFAEYILQLSEPITTFTNGSGDTTYDYVLIPTMFSFALIGTIIWTAIDRDRLNHNRLLYWLLVFLRYYLCFTLLTYGFAKTFKLQFPSPNLIRLLQPYGDSSPMGLAWTFMGYSTTYNWFTGLAEVIPGILLLFRRTTLLGALMAMGVMLNIVMMNFSFDIPVKLYSTHLFLMAVFIALPHLPRILNFFFRNQVTPVLIDECEYFSPSWLRASRVVKYVIIAALLGLNIYQRFENQKQYGDKAPRPPLRGIYEVETFMINSDTIPPLLTDTRRWRRLILDGYKSYPYSALYKMDDEKTRMRYTVDSVEQKIVFNAMSGEKLELYNFDYQLVDSTLVLNGIDGQDTLSIHCNLRSADDFLLTNRGFNWINEYPFNR